MLLGLLCNSLISKSPTWASCYLQVVEWTGWLGWYGRLQTCKCKRSVSATSHCLKNLKVEIEQNVCGVSSKQDPLAVRGTFQWRQCWLLWLVGLELECLVYYWIDVKALCSQVEEGVLWLMNIIGTHFQHRIASLSLVCHLFDHIWTWKCVLLQTVFHD